MKSLTKAERVKLMQLLDLPSGAHVCYEGLAETYGETFEEVVRFALLNWLHANVTTIDSVLRDS